MKKFDIPKAVLVGFFVSLPFPAAASPSGERLVRETCSTFYDENYLGPTVHGRPHFDVHFRSENKAGENYFDVRGCGKDRHLKLTLGPLADGENGYIFYAVPLYKVGEFDLIAFSGDVEGDQYQIYDKSTGYKFTFFLEGYATYKIVDTDKDGVYEFEISVPEEVSETHITVGCSQRPVHDFKLSKSSKIVIKATSMCPVVSSSDTELH